MPMDSDKLPARGLSLTNPDLACQLSSGPKGKALHSEEPWLQHTPHTSPSPITNLGHKKNMKCCVPFKPTG